MASLLRPAVRARAPVLSRAIHTTPLLYADASKPTGKSQGLIGSLLHGSEEAKEEGKIDLQSHSNMVARGKYIHQIVKHKVPPHKTEEYKSLIGNYYGAIAKRPELGIKLTGSWEVIVGELDTFYHILEFDNGYKGWDASIANLHNSEEYNDLKTRTFPLVKERSSNLAQEFSFWPTKPPANLGGVYEMRIYNLKPGALLEWETEWRQGLEARRQHHEPIAAFFTQLGKLHQVCHIWHYKDLHTRQKLRKAAWTVEGWSSTVSKTVKMTIDMQANIMKPLPFSPLR